MNANRQSYSHVAASRHHGGSSPRSSGVSGRPSHCSGTSTPMASQIVGSTSTFSVNRSTTVPWPAGAAGSRTIPTTW